MEELRHFPLSQATDAMVVAHETPPITCFRRAGCGVVRLPALGAGFSPADPAVDPANNRQAEAWKVAVVGMVWSGLAWPGCAQVSTE